jgi:single-stranded DNA-specific DHH superfamily exonuclease
MVLPAKQIKEIREALETCSRPLFIYDDDPDGLCSFLLLYRFVGEGRGVILKTTSHLTKEWVRKVDEYGPDKVFILDVPVVEQEFIDEVKVPMYWIDHHMPLERKNINYYNPRIQKIDAYIPTTRMAYEIVKKDIWIAAIGSIADWYIPDFTNEFVDQFPDLMKKGIKSPDEALYDMEVGKLVRIFAFLIKGKTSDVFKSIKTLTRIESPYELLKQTTPAGKFLYQRFKKINDRYEELIKRAKKTKTKDGFFIFTYDADQWSFTSELGNELSYLNQDKVVLVCREKDGQYKCSLRSREKPILEPLKKAVANVQGGGGGHEHACGVAVASEDFDRFVAQLREEYKNA